MSVAPAIFGSAFRGFRGNASMPSPPSAADAGRGGGTVATKDVTIGELITDLEIAPNVAEAIKTALGCTSETKASRLAFAPRAVLDKAVSDLKIDGVDASVMDKADMGRLVGQILQEKSEDKAETKTAKTEPEKDQNPLGALYFRDHLDFMDQGTFKLLPPAELQACLDHYEAVLGGQPPESQIPSDEQLSALVARLQSGRTPYADFSVWGPFDERTAYMRKFEDQVMIDGVWSRKPLRGPQNFTAWMQSWQVYKVAMCSLDVMTPQAMDDYADGIRQLVTLFPQSRYPSSWATILLADIEMRSKQWWRILANLRRSPAPENKLDKDRQWNTVLRMSCYGKAMDAERLHWWNLHVIFPLQNQPAAASNVVAELDGVPAEAAVFQPAGAKRATNPGEGSSSRKKRAKGAATPMARPAPQQANHSKGKGEVCYAWNDGGCKEVCPQGRSHICSNCGGVHRRVNCPKGSGKGSNMNGGGVGDGGAKNKRKKAGGKGGRSTK